MFAGVGVGVGVGVGGVGLPSHAMSDPIAIAIAVNRPDAQVTGIDQSAVALAITRKNAELLAASNLRLLQSDWFSAVEGETFDIIVSNPPYIAAADPHLEVNRLPAIWYEAVLRWEDRYVMGATLPGCPLFAVARTNDVAWGVTYMKGDAIDYFIEDCRPAVAPDRAEPTSAGWASNLDD